MSTRREIVPTVPSHFEPARRHRHVDRRDAAYNAKVVRSVATGEPAPSSTLPWPALRAL